MQSTFCSSTEAEFIVCRYNKLCGPPIELERKSNDDKNSVENGIDENESLTNGRADNDDKDYDGNKGGNRKVFGSDDNEDKGVKENKYHVLEKDWKDIIDTITKTNDNEDKKDDFANEVTNMKTITEKNLSAKMSSLTKISGKNDVNEQESINVDAGNNYDAGANASKVGNFGQKDNINNPKYDNSKVSTENNNKSSNKSENNQMNNNSKTENDDNNNN